MHSHSEVYLWSGTLDRGEYMESRNKCLTQYAVYSGTWHGYFMHVVRQHLQQFFRSGVVADDFPMTIENKTPLSSPLWNNKYWKEKVFDRTTGIRSVSVT